MRLKNYCTVALFLSLILLTACSDDESNNELPSESSQQIMATETVYTQTGFEYPETSFISESEVAESTDIIDDYNDVSFQSRYGYYQLTEEEREVYDQIMNAAKRFQTTIILDNRLPRESVKRICEILILEENDLYYLAPEYQMVHNTVTGLVSEVTLIYQYNSMTVDIINEKVNKRADEILSGITEDMSDYDIVKYFHDTIILNCVNSVEGDYVAIPYGALVDGKALCEGYSRAFAYLCNKAEIENIYATGVTSDGIDHIWNMVKLDNEWYNIDLTWDDPDNLSEQIDFLQGKYISYNYFLFKTSQYNGSMKFSDLFVLPQANADKYNYFVKNDLVAKNYEETCMILKREMQRVYNLNQNIVDIKVSDKKEYEKVINTLLTTKIYDYTPEGYGLNSVFCLTDENNNTFQIILNY